MTTNNIIPNNFIKKMEEVYGVQFPDRLIKFYNNKEYANLNTIDLVEGYSRGSYDLCFTDTDLLNLDNLAENSGIDEMPAVEEWKKTFSGIIPFASMTYPKGDEEDEPPKCFIVTDVATSDCPVYLWDYDGWHIYAIAHSLDDFIAGKAPDKSAKFRKIEQASIVYEEFKWVK